MTGVPFKTAVLGGDAAIVTEAAWGADLSDIDGSGWTWTDITTAVRHDPGTTIVAGRTDNVSQAGAAKFTATLKNPDGLYTAGGPADVGVAQNTPVRQRMTINGDDYALRFQGYLDTANPTTDQSAKVKAVAISALGALGRIGGLKKPQRSALYRAVASSAPSAHWPLEDGKDSTAGVNDVPGSVMRVVSVGPVFGADGGPGSAAGVDFSKGGVLAGQIPASAATSWRVEFSALWPVLAPFTGATAVTLYAPPNTGTVANWEIEGSASNGLVINVNFSDSSTTAFASNVSINDGRWHRVRVEATKSGSNVGLVVTLDGTAVITQTLSSVVFGGLSDVYLNNGISGTTMAAMSSVVAWTPWAGSVDTMAAATGYAGELAHDRLTRLFAENGYALDVIGTSRIKMGAQGTDTFLNLARECEAADHGLLYDGFGPGCAYQCASARYNASPALILDMAEKQATGINPVFDRQALKNLYDVTRKGGATVTYERTAGPTGSVKVGVEDAQATVNVERDYGLIQHAGWLVALGTVPGFRYPSTTIDLSSIPTLAINVLALLPGGRLTIANPASKSTDLPPDDVDLIIEGWQETTTKDTWRMVLNQSPFAPYRVFVCDEDNLDDPNVGLAL